MDVRCQKCQTEYELDDARIKATGTTVKCTQCGYLFRVLPSGRAVSEDGMPSHGGDGVDWMIRDSSGRVQTFHELTTLQQWIVERKVTRDCAISKRGEKWKRLGEITELASFFQVVDRAQAAVQKADKGRSTQPFAHSVIISPRPSSPAKTIPGAGMAHARTKPDMVGPRTPGPRTPGPRTPGPRTPGPHHGALQTPGSVEPAWTANRESAFRVTGQPSGPVATPSRAGGAIGMQPVAGAPRPTPGGPPGFAPPANAPTRPVRASTFDGEPPMSDYDPDTFHDDEDDLYVQRSKAPWIVLGMLLLAGTGAGAYLVLFWNQGGTPVAAIEPDAGAMVTPDAATARTQPVPMLTPFVRAMQKFDGDTEAGYADAENLLQGARSEVPKEDARVLAAMARVNSAWVQVLRDKATLVEDSDKRRAQQYRAEAARKYARAKKFANDARKRSDKATAVLVALADVKRVAKTKRRVVERLLKLAKNHPDKKYIAAMMLVRDGRVDQAKEMLLHVMTDYRDATGRDHIRAQFQLALLAFGDNDMAGAQEAVQAILALSPGHERAKLLAQKISGQDELATDTSPIDVGDSGDKAAATDSMSYEALVKKGNSLSERGRCSEAMKLFEKAKDDRPGGVEALTGIGYCHLDASNYHSAHANFRSALGVSPRYGDAMIGIAEVYRQQRNHLEAYKGYKKYLEAHPNGSKAPLARRNAERLKPADAPPDLPSPVSDPTPPVPDPTPPEPDPAPKEDPVSTTAPEEPTEVPPENVPDKQPEKQPDPPAPAPDPAPSQSEATPSE